MADGVTASAFEATPSGEDSLNEDRHVFGYGSLVWKFPYPMETRIVCCVKGFKRRFWQASEDHRGVPGAPGRVATLVPDPPGTDPPTVTWGVAAELSPESYAESIAALDYRERGGYTRVTVPVYKSDAPDAEPFAYPTLYIGTEDNPQFVGGTETLDEIAQVIAAAEGPSGRNTEYLFRLAEALREMGVDDGHVFGLEARVKSILAGGEAAEGTE